MSESSLFVFFVLCAFLCAGEETATFIHVTDTHLHEGYAPGTNPAKHCRGGSGDAGSVGDYRCDTSGAVYESAWRTVAALANATGARFVLYGGDTSSLDGPSSRANSEARLADVAERLRALQAALPGLRVFPALGNHDAYPYFQFRPAGPFWVYELAAELWAPFLSAESVATVRRGGYYTEVLEPGLRLVVLNTAEFFFGNLLISTNNTDPGGQMTWLRGVLDAARAAGERVYIHTHIPPGYDEIVHSPLMWKEFNELLLDALDPYNGDVVVASFYGHVHLDSFRLVRRGGSARVHPGFLAGSLTPRWWTNPALSVYTYRPAAPFDVLDKEVYTVDLPRANAAGVPAWTPLYRATAAYGVPDLSTPSVLAMAQRLAQDANYFAVFHKNIKLGQSGHFPQCAGLACQQLIMCTVLYTAHNDTWDCLTRVRAGDQIPLFY